VRVVSITTRWFCVSELVTIGWVEVEQVEQLTADAVGELVAALQDAADVSVRVYRRDEDMWAARPDTAHLPARWWRHVVARACEEVPGVVIVSADAKSPPPG